METVSNLRVRFCLQTNELMCGPYTEALVVDVRPNAATTSAASLAGQPWLIAVVVVVVVLSLAVALAFVRCCCCGGAKAKALKTEREGGRPTIIHGTAGGGAGQQPPPYTTATNYSGIENKGADAANGKDLSDDNLKANGLFGATTAPAAPTYPFANGEHASNNSNSANGGSVNSQDSLWNVKSNNGQIPGEVVQQQQQYSLHHHHHPHLHQVHTASQSLCLTS